MWLLGAWNDAESKDLADVESYFRREIVVEYDDWPSGTLPSVKQCKPISRQAQRDVTMVIKVVTDAAEDTYYTVMTTIVSGN